MSQHRAGGEAAQVILITGAMAAGKSTVAQALAERLPRSVHLRGDLFRRMIVSGQATMGFELSDEAVRQLHLRYRLATGAAHEYAAAGFTVVYQDIVIGPDLARVVSALAPLRTALVVLCPTPDALAAREAARPKTGYASQSEIAAFDRVLRDQTPRIGYWLDSSDLTVAQTVEAMLAHLREALLPGPPAV
jgi:predicted kinase